jgi:hypothetical protein
MSLLQKYGLPLGAVWGAGAGSAPRSSYPQNSRSLASPATTPRSSATSATVSVPNTSATVSVPTPRGAAPSPVRQPPVPPLPLNATKPAVSSQPNTPRSSVTTPGRMSLPFQGAFKKAMAPSPTTTPRAPSSSCGSIPGSAAGSVAGSVAGSAAGSIQASPKHGRPGDGRILSQQECASMGVPYGSRIMTSAAAFKPAQQASTAS